MAVAGDPEDRGVFYFGACAGGVWKTIDGGVYWRCVTDGCFGSAAIGALAVAPSDPNVVYAGTGETEIRLDVCKPATSKAFTEIGTETQADA